MNKFIRKGALFALSAVALPAAALAGQSTATGSAKMAVIDQCGVSAGIVNLGTFLSTQTWGDVGDELGWNSGTVMTIGTRGTEYLEWGTVTCAKDTNYSLTIRGTATDDPGIIQFTVGGNRVGFYPYVKKFGDQIVPDGTYGKYGSGAFTTGAVTAPAGVGTGEPQKILGSVQHGTRHSFANSRTTVIGTAGSYTDALTYKLTF